MKTKEKNNLPGMHLYEILGPQAVTTNKLIQFLKHLESNKIILVVV